MKSTAKIHSINQKSEPVAALPIVKIDLSKRVIDSTLEELGAVVFDASLLAFEAYKAGEQPAPELLTGAQMAAKLGISRSKLHALRLEGCPAVKVGETFKFEPRAVMAHLRGQSAK